VAGLHFAFSLNAATHEATGTVATVTKVHAAAPSDLINSGSLKSPACSCVSITLPASTAEARERLREKFMLQSLQVAAELTQRGREILSQPAGNSKPDAAAKMLVAGNDIARAALGLPSVAAQTFNVTTVLGTQPSKSDVRVEFNLPDTVKTREEAVAFLTPKHGDDISDEEAQPIIPRGLLDSLPGARMKTILP